jgi:hypothetical protein
MSKIQLILQVETIPVLTVTVNGQKAVTDVFIDEYNNLQVAFDFELAESNQLAVIVNGQEVVTLIEIIVDGIRFGLATFLCTTVNNTQNTQITAPGQIDIELRTPIWKFWCDKMTDFNYERYPLGSIN